MQRNVQTDDWQLLDQFRGGSQAAFARLVERHVGFVYHVCRRRLRDGHLAEDAAQAVFVVLARRAPATPAAHVTLAAWLYRTALHACANAQRARQRRRRHETTAAQLRDEVVHTCACDDDEEGRGERQLEQALAALRGADREIVLMRFYEDRSLDAIGRSIGVSAGTAAKRLSRAVARLRRHFAAAGDDARLRAMLGAVAPVGLAGRAVDSAVGTGGATSQLVHETAKGVVRAMIRIKAKLIAATTAAVVSCIVGAVTSVSLLLAQPAPPGRGPEAPAAATTTRPSPATAPAGAATPKEVMREFGAAIRAADAARMRALIDARDEDNRRLTDVVGDYVEGAADLRVAIAEKFGKPALAKLADQLGTLTPIDYLGAVIDPMIEHLEETIDGDVAILRPPDPDIDTFVFVRVDGRWKVSADRMTAEWGPQDWEPRENMLRRANEAVRAMTQQVRDGEIQTIAEFKQELAEVRNR